MEKNFLNYNTTAIILAGGTGKRMNSNVSKQLLKINDKHILEITIEKFQSNNNISEIIIVSNEKDLKFLQDNICNKFSKIKKVVLGGEERQYSVYNALKHVSNNVQYILIHDGVRPFVSHSNINKIIFETIEYEAVVLGVPSKNTIKSVDEKGFIKTTLNRSELFEIHTPQCFEKNIIKEAYEKLIKEPVQVTDDASVVEKFTEKKVKLVIDSYNNIKITTKEDLNLAYILAKKNNKGYYNE